MHKCESWFIPVSAIAVLFLCCCVGCTPTNDSNSDGSGSTQGGQLFPDGACECASNEKCLNNSCVCMPKCDGTHSREDGCGGWCHCPHGKVNNASGQCVPEVSCLDTCEDAGWMCGKLCDRECGICKTGDICISGQCDKVMGPSLNQSGQTTAPLCPCEQGLVCNASNRCVLPDQCEDTCERAGRTCGTLCGHECGTCQTEGACIDGRCAGSQSCADCDLKLTVLAENSSSDIKLTVDYNSGQNVERIRIADVRIMADSSCDLKNIVRGDALVAAEKQFYIDDVTNNPYRFRSDGSYQFLVHSLEHIKAVETGRLATLTFSCTSQDPIVFHLIRRPRTLAPQSADASLQATPYENKVVVVR